MTREEKLATMRKVVKYGAKQDILFAISPKEIGAFPITKHSYHPKRKCDCAALGVKICKGECKYKYRSAGLHADEMLEQIDVNLFPMAQRMMRGKKKWGIIYADRLEAHQDMPHNGYYHLVPAKWESIRCDAANPPVRLTDIAPVERGIGIFKRGLARYLDDFGETQPKGWTPDRDDICTAIEVYVHFVNRTKSELEKYTHCLAGMPARITRLVELKGEQVIGREGKRHRTSIKHGGKSE